MVAAALTPFGTAGNVEHSQVAPYVTALARDGIGGLAIGAHTGRGGHLAPADFVRLVHESRAATGLPVVAGVGRPGAPVGDVDPAEAVLPIAERLCAAGADALLVVPPSGADRATVVALHERLGAELATPLIAFVLYERASGCCYDAATVVELIAQPWVVGTKLALLDDAMACQDIIVAMRRERPDALVITGEDRMFGPSLLWGADSALVGVAAALPARSVEVMDAWRRRDYPAFIAASARLDRFAAATFREPMEGYVQRMARAAARQGILPAAVDPYGPALSAAELAQLDRDLTIEGLPEL